MLLIRSNKTPGLHRVSYGYKFQRPYTRYPQSPLLLGLSPLLLSSSLPPLIFSIFSFSLCCCYFSFFGYLIPCFAIEASLFLRGNPFLLLGSLYLSVSSYFIYTLLPFLLNCWLVSSLLFWSLYLIKWLVLAFQGSSPKSPRHRLSALWGKGCTKSWIQLWKKREMLAKQSPRLCKGSLMFCERGESIFDLWQKAWILLNNSDYELHTDHDTEGSRSCSVD